MPRIHDNVLPEWQVALFSFYFPFISAEMVGEPWATDLRNAIHLLKTLNLQLKNLDSMEDTLFFER